MRFLRLALSILAVLGVVYFYFAAVHPHERVPDHVYFQRPGPWAMAHRGGRGLWPEHTFHAFEKAAALGVDVLEMDLRATSDGAIVVMHDATVNRTTNGNGRVDGMALAEVLELDAGYRFEDASGQFVYRGRGLVVPTLEEVLRRFPKTRLNLEMKEFTPDLAVKLCHLLSGGAATDRVLVASFGHEAMSAFRQACPEVATSATMREGLSLYVLSRMRLASLYRSPASALQIPENPGGRTALEPQLIELAGALNVRVQVWTVNEEADMRRLLDMGVQGILTDYPDRLLRVMGRQRH